MAWSFPSGNTLLKGIGTILGSASGSFTKYIVFAGILAVGGAAFYWYYNDSQDRLKENADRIAKQEIAIATEKATIKQMEIDLETHKYILKEVYADLEEARKQSAKEDIDPEFDLETELLKDLGATEDKLNYKYNNELKCFSLYSGVPVVELEKDLNAQAKLMADCGLIGTTVNP